MKRGPREQDLFTRNTAETFLTGQPVCTAFSGTEGTVPEDILDIRDILDICDILHIFHRTAFFLCFLYLITGDFFLQAEPPFSFLHKI